MPLSMLLTMTDEKRSKVGILQVFEEICLEIGHKQH